ncbi:unnamed protein product, partial [marine sediment metagenome]
GRTVEMKRKIRINPRTYLAYIPEDIIQEGFVEDVDAYANAKTLTIVHPEASLEEVERSLEIVLADIRLRRGSPPGQGESTEGAVAEAK